MDEGETNTHNKILSVTGYVIDSKFQKIPILLGLVELCKFDADTITNETLRIVKRRNISLNYIVGGATDGASTMMGKNSGVMIRLKDYCEFLQNYHCANHNLNLSVQDAVSED